MTDQAPAPQPALTNVEIAKLIDVLWESLLSPGWSFSNRKDLEKLGEAIYTGKKLQDLDDKLFDRLYPHLKTVATHLGLALKRQTVETPAAPATPAETPHE